MGTFRDDENIGNSYYPKNIVKQKGSVTFFFNTLTDFKSEAVGIVS